MEEHKSKYTLVVHKKRVAVSEEVYKAYYHCRDREIYLNRLAEKNNISLESYIEKGIPLEYIIASEDATIENIIRQETLEKLRAALKRLSGQERLLIYALFFKGKSESALAGEMGIHQSNVSRRKVRILSKLKKFLEI